MLNKFIRHKYLLIAIWCVSILIIFKLTTDFVFKGGSSVLFLLLFFGFPLTLNYLAKNKAGVLRRQKYAKKAGFLDQIHFDIRTGLFQSLFLTPLMKENKPQMQIKEEEITLYFGKSNLVRLSFIKEKAELIIIDTMIKYNFFYSKAFYDLTKFDERGFEYRGTAHLYQRLLILLNKLLGKEFQYEEVFYGKDYAGCLLKKDDEIIYQLVLKEKKRFFKKTKVINKQFKL